MNFSSGGAGVLIALSALGLFFWPKIKKIFHRDHMPVDQESKLDD